MEVLILNGRNEQVALVENIESLIWDEHYSDAGVFEVHCPHSAELLRTLRIGYRVIRVSGSTEIGIIESVRIYYTSTGRMIRAVGRFALCLLERRIVLDYRKYNDKNPVAICRDLINRNIINATHKPRRVSRLRCGTETLAVPVIDGQYRGENLYTAVTQICAEAGIGIRSELDLETNEIVYHWYQGTDRTQLPSVISPVILSADYGTLTSSTWEESSVGQKNVAYVAGQGDGSARTIATTRGTASGESRQEVWVDARDVSDDLDTGSQMVLLRARGEKEIAKNAQREAYDVQPNIGVYEYRNHYNVGDLVSIVDGSIYGVARVQEAAETYEGDGMQLDLTLQVLSFEYANADKPSKALLDEDGKELIDENGLILEDS